MGFDDNKFISAFDKNIELQVQEAIAANVVGNAIIKLMEELENKTRSYVTIKEDCNSNCCSLLWKGTATDLFLKLEETAARLKINTHKSWPKAANILSRRINEIKTNLREIGIVIDNRVRDIKTNVKIIEIRKTSLISLESLADENHAQVTSDTPNDNINNHNDKSLDDNEISLGKTPQIHAQNSQANDTNDSNDTLQLLRNQQASDTSYPSYPSDKKKILEEFIEENGIYDVIDEMLSGI